MHGYDLKGPLGPPHTKCCPVWNLILPRLQANELAFGSSAWVLAGDMKLGGWKLRTYSSQDSKQHVCARFLLLLVLRRETGPEPDGEHAQGACALGEGHRAWGIHDSDSQQCASLSFIRRRHYLIPQGFLLMTP